MSTLGKRTRSSRASSPEPAALQELPAKKVRRSRRTVVDDKENQQPEATASIDASEDADADAPRKSRLATIAFARPRASPITPSTPRHYDAFAKTPSATPRHRVMSVGRLSSRLTPQTPLTPAASQTVYHQAKQLFSRSADPGPLIGRDEERAALQAFLARCTTSQPGGCVYVSGPPGTGKSAMVKAMSDATVAAGTQLRKAYINCMSIKSSKDLYMTLLEQLGDDSDLSENDAQAALQKLFVPKKKSGTAFLVVLDEIDHVVTLDPESLYRVFEWSLHKATRLALVGIANALDLTDRFLPRLKSKNLKPELLPFLPYKAAQVKNIITTRLKSLVPAGASTPDYVPFFHPAAIELCSRKVSTQTGDLRRAFEICRRALDLVESETRERLENEAKDELLQMTPSKKAVLGENKNLSPGGMQTGSSRSVPARLLKSLQALTVANAPRVSVAHLSKVTAAAFGHGTSHRLKALNLQQKAALCALMAMDKRNRAALSAPTTWSPATTTGPRTGSKARAVAAPTVKALFDAYSLLCKRDALLHPLSRSEFREVMGSLETLSLVAPVDGRNGSFAAAGLATPGSGRGRRTNAVDGDDKRVASCVGDKEIEQAVDGPGADILRSILSGEALD